MAGTLPAAPTLGSMSAFGSGSRNAAGGNPQVLEIPPGPAGLEVLWQPLAEALAGGPALAPIPQPSPATPQPVVDAMVAAARPNEPVAADTALVVATSGSTGNPRGVELSGAAVQALTAEVNARAGGNPAWVLAIPATSIGGLNVAIRAHAAGQPPIALDSLAGATPFTAEVFARGVEAARDTDRPVAVSLVPAQLPRLLASDIGRAALRQCALVLVGGAALAPQAARDCAAADVLVTTTYGMTETSGGCIFAGHPLDGVEVRIGDEKGTDDRVYLRGPMLATRYRDDRGELIVDGWLRTNDRGRWAGGQLQILGRLDDVVTVRGVNVDVVAVEDRLRDHPGIQDALVLVVPDPDTDNRLHAAYIADDRNVPADEADANLTDADLRTWVGDFLGKEAAPVTLQRVESFSATATGKIDRRATARDLGLADHLAQGPGRDLL